jgi:hypothetical protein
VAALALALALVCPHVPSLGTVAFDRGGTRHLLSLATCRESVGPPLPNVGRAAPGLYSRSGRYATVTIRRHGSTGTQAIVAGGRPVYTVREDYRTVPAGTPGPLGLVAWSPDSRWVFFHLDPMGSASLAADGLRLQAIRVRDARRVRVTDMLAYPDYATWCGSALVLTAGEDRIATHDKRLVVARAPDWRPRPLWTDPRRAFGSVACSPDGRSVAVLSQRRTGTDETFAQARWELWQVGLDGSRRLLDAPPAGFADESPRWSRDGRALLFVREHAGRGSLMLWRAGRVTGPIADLGNGLDYYGHRDWWQTMSWSAGA